MLDLLKGECIWWCPSGVAMYPGYKAILPAAPPERLEGKWTDGVEEAER